jgi:16S rRNA (guanine(966)-N(2))-methyltransferase RsmD
MRVIAGKAKGRRLTDVKGPGTRPITDRAKSALFSILSYDVQNARFLDLFAGTGQVGIEALSRGAECASFVEYGQEAVRSIYTNLRVTGLEERASVHRVDVFRFLTGTPQSFDYVFIAPPQYRQLWIKTLHQIDNIPAWLAADGWVVVQINPVEFQPLELENLHLFDQRTYGSVMLCFYSLADEGIDL